MSELLPRPLRLLIGATGAGVSEQHLRQAVSGRVVLVTGAASGIGRAAAQRLGAAGATVLLVARRGELLDQVRHEMAESPRSPRPEPSGRSGPTTWPRPD